MEISKTMSTEVLFLRDINLWNITLGELIIMFTFDRI